MHEVGFGEGAWVAGDKPVAVRSRGSVGVWTSVAWVTWQNLGVGIDKGEFDLWRVLHVVLVCGGCEPNPLVIGDVHAFLSARIGVIGARVWRRGWPPEPSQGGASRQHRGSTGNRRRRCGRGAAL